MRPPESDCTCPHAIASLGMLDGISMGKGRVRTATVKDCPVHDSCHGYTKADRAARKAKESWSDPYCPIHAGRNCPVKP